MGYLSTLIGCRNRYLVPSCRYHHCCPSLQNICIYPFRDHKYPCLNKCENRYQRGKSEGSNRNPRSHHHKDIRRSCRHPMSRPRSDRSRKLWVTANRLHFRGAIPALSCTNSSRARCRMVPILFLRNPKESIVAGAFSRRAVTYAHVGALDFLVMSNIICAGVSKPC
jgi:hypothetical protein